MAPDPEDVVQTYKAQIQKKIQKLVAEFAEGSISREQFHVLYDRYNSQLALADMAASSSMPQAIMGIVEDGTPTLVVRAKTMGKAVGIAIYNNRNGILLETLGDFDVPSDTLAPILNDITMLMEGGKLVEREVREIGPKQWLTFAGGKFTTVVTLFQNQPSDQQMREITRLHHDFEEANKAFFKGGQVDASRLAYPFVAFIERAGTRFDLKP